MKTDRARPRSSRVRPLALVAGLGVAMALSFGVRADGVGRAFAAPGIRQPGPDGPPMQALTATGDGADGQAAQAIVSYFQATYAIAGFKPPWFDALLEINVRDGVVTASTNLGNDDAGVASAAQVCNALAGYVYSPDAQGAFLTRIIVNSVAGSILAVRDSPTMPC